MYKYHKFAKYNNMKTIFKNNYFILIPLIILNIISLLYLFKTPYFTKQFIYIILSLIFLLIASKINYKFIHKYSKYFYLISIILLIIVLLVGKEIKGSKAWLHLYKLSIQPSEITKLTLSIYLVYLVSKHKSLLYIILMTVLPSILTFLEPDTGAVIIYLIIFLSILSYLKINKKVILTLISIFIIFIFIHLSLYFVNKDLLINIYGPKIFYRLDRLVSFQNLDNIQNTNSLISIGAHKLLYIPENHNDFIFASLISKYNILIFITILLSYLLIFFYYLNRINKKNNVSNLINSIILNTLLFQVFYNILMNLSLLPIIGIPLPFLSYGGSYLLTLYILIGLSINLNINPNKRMD